VHVLGVVYIMKRREWGLAAWWTWVAGGVCFVLWIRNKLATPAVEYALVYPLQRIYWLWQVHAVRRCRRGAQEGHLICRLGYCRVAQSIGLVNTGPGRCSLNIENETGTISRATLEFR
jgi:hypothetical protein